jgi:hypothetical protein
MSRGKFGVSISVLAVCGVILFLVGIMLIISTLPGILRAFALDHNQLGGGEHSTECGAALLGGVPKWSIDVRRLMSENETQALTVTLENSHQDCPYALSLNAPEFSINPDEPIREIPLATQTPASFVWILSPTKLGTFAVAVELGTPANYEVKVVGITVTNSFGLSLWQVQILSYISTALGPILTVAWWYDKWQERKRRKSEEVSLASTTKPPKPHRRARQKR